MIKPSVFLVTVIICVITTQHCFHVEAKGTKKEGTPKGSSASTAGLPYFVPETVSAAKGESKASDAGKDDKKGSKNDSPDSSTQDFGGTIYFPQVGTAVGTSKAGKSANKTSKESKAPKAGKESKAPKAGNGSSKAPKAGNGSTKTPKAGNGDFKGTKAPKAGKNGFETKAPKGGKDGKTGKDAKASKTPKVGKASKAPKATGAPKSSNVESVTTSSAAVACPFQPSGGAILNPSNVVGEKPSTSGRGVLTIAFDAGFTQMEYSVFIADVPAINDITLNCISSGNSTDDFITSLSFRDPGSSYSSIVNGTHLGNISQCEDGSVISNVVGLYDVMRRGLVYVEASVVDSTTGENPVFIRGDIQVATTPGTC